MRTNIRLLLLAASVLCIGYNASAGAAQMHLGFNTDPQLPADAVERISQHVYAIKGFPNIGIVIGDQASLVVDTGLGPRNGALVFSEVKKLRKVPKLYLVTTHFHPEHASGEAGFPPDTILVRSRVQQQELEDDHGKVIGFFTSNPTYAPYLKDVTFRKPDILFDQRYRLDLGGVHVRLMALGPAHTRGDEAFFVEEDRALFTGDLAMKTIRPGYFTKGSSWQTWITILDRLAALRPRYVLPDHGEFGDATLISDQRAYLEELVARSATVPSR